MIDETRIAFLTKKLGITREEAIELEGYDNDVDHNKRTPYDLTKEQRQNIMEMNRKREHKKIGVRKAERKPNENKEGIISAVADFLANECEFSINDKSIACENVEITNKNRMIHFVCNSREYDFQLIEKRLPKNTE